MIHRLLYAALGNGLQRFIQNPALFDQLFEQLGVLDPAEVARVKKVFTDRMPPLEHAYSPSPADYPIFVVATGSESQAQTVLGNEAGMFSSALPSNQPIFSSIWQHSHSIMCYAAQPDFVQYMYEMAKCAIYLNLDFLQRHNCMQVQLGGSEVTVEDRAPERPFVRTLSFSCAREFRIFDPQAQTQIYQVDGLFVAGGSNSSNGGVTSNIRPATPDI